MCYCVLFLFEDTNTGSGTTVAAVAVVSIVVLGLLVVLIVMIVVWFVHRGKKTGSMDIYSHRPVSRSSKDIFFHMEETVVSIDDC